MTQYIDKSALLVEIDRQKIGYNVDGKHSVEYDTTRKILNIIDGLVTKEVDLEKEIDNYFNTSIRKNIQANDNVTLFMQVRKAAKHFFKLGISINHPITASDKGMAEEIILNLEKIEKEYNICLIKEKEWVNKQIQKG